MFCYNNVLMFSPMGGKERTSVYLVGWANAWDWMPFWKDWGPTYQEGWCGFFNIPREAVLAEDNTLKFIPVKELQDLRKNKQEEADILIKEDEKKELRSGCVYETEMRINLKKSTADKIRLNLRMSQGKKTEILFDLRKAEAYFDRNNSDGWSKGVARCPLNFVLIFLYSINNLFFLTIHRFLLLPLQSPPFFTYVINTVRFIYHVNFIELISFVYRIIFLNNLFN